MRWTYLFVVCCCCFSLVADRATAQGERDLTVVVADNWVQGFGVDGNVAWQFRTVGTVTAGQIIDKDRLLLALTGLVVPTIVETDFRGKIVWKRELSNDYGDIRAVQRFTDGSTFVVQSTRIVEINPNGAQKELHRRPAALRERLYPMMDGQKLPDGRIAILTSDAMFRLLQDGREVKAFSVGVQDDFGGPGELAVLPDGGVIVSKWKHQVVQFDADGKQLWGAKVNSPHSMQRLSNGNILLASFADHCVVELDTEGTEVWRLKVSDRPSLALRPMNLPAIKP